MVNYSGCIDRIFEILQEARTRNYPEHVLRYDLNNYLKDVYETSEKEFNEQLEWAIEEAREDERECSYQEGYDEGCSDSKEEHRDGFIEELADRIIEFKAWLCNTDPTKHEIQLKITELLVEMDDNCCIDHTARELKLNEFDIED